VEYGILDLLKLLGSLVLFLFGMKLMSESLQKVAGDRMRGILAAMTSNKYKGILTGFVITAIIQSSSATTVMLVSFVNAGLVSLAESIGVIMGANIGTTVTAWLISILGFKIEISQLVLPLMGLALPLIFSNNRRRSNWGTVIIGFATIFIGLDFLKNATPDIHNNPELLAFLGRFSNLGYWSVMIYLLLGAVITMVIQSSSAVMALTLVMCFNGWLSFEMAAAMVLGQNIGTTITANLAALIANTTAKRTARAHFLFNVIGVIIALIFFKPFLEFVDWLTTDMGLPSPYHVSGQTLRETAEAIPVALSIYHTVFNILNTLLLMWFISAIMRIVIWMVPQKEDDEEFRLQYITTGLLSTNELSILQAKKETIVYAGKINKMFELTDELITSQNSKRIQKLLQKIRKFEEISDQMEVEIASYLTKISEESISNKASEQINSLLFIISHIENMGDACHNLLRSTERRIDQKFQLTADMEKNLKQVADLCKIQISEIIMNLNLEKNEIDHQKIVDTQDRLQKILEKIQNEHFKNLKKGTYKCKEGIIYSDLYNGIADIGKYAFEINKLLAGVSIAESVVS
jgi:phosphate:Na+ symporter